MVSIEYDTSPTDLMLDKHLKCLKIRINHEGFARVRMND